MCINLLQKKTCYMADFVSNHYGPLLQHIHISVEKKKTRLQRHHCAISILTEVGHIKHRCIAKTEDQGRR